MLSQQLNLFKKQSLDLGEKSEDEWLIQEKQL